MSRQKGLLRKGWWLLERLPLSELSSLYPGSSRPSAVAVPFPAPFFCPFLWVVWMVFFGGGPRELGGDQPAQRSVRVRC